LRLRPPGRGAAGPRSTALPASRLLGAALLLALAATPAVVRAATLPRPGPAPAVAPPRTTPRAPHTQLLATYPAADTVHLSEIAEVVLRFSTAVQPTLSTITVFGPGGVIRDAGAVTAVAGSEEREIRVALGAPLSSGAYAVEWRTAGPDGHPLRGTFSFSVEWTPDGRAADSVAAAEGGEDVPPSQAGSTPLHEVPDSGSGERAWTPVGTGIRWLFFLSLVGMLGTAIFRLAVIGPLARDPLLGEAPAGASRAIRRLAWVAAALALLALPARLLLQSSELFGEGALETSSLASLLSSQWGGAWLLELAMLALFSVGVLLVGGDQDRRRGWWVMLLAGLGTALVPPLSGHASGSPPEVRAFAILNDALHVTAAGFWMGGLAVLLLAGVRSLRGASAAVPAPSGDAWAGEEGVVGEDGVPDEAAAPTAMLPPLARLVNAFSRIAIPCVAVLVLTGFVNAWLHLGSVADLFTSGYGRALLLKLAFVGGAASLGFYNWRVVRPALATSPTAGLIRIPATLELTLGIAVLLITSVLVALPPPLPS